MGVIIKTKPFGEIEVNEEQIIDFPDGILGFDFIKKFVLLDTGEEKSPFKWLQAYDEPELAFVIISPIDFMSEYELSISQNDVEAVSAEKVANLLVFAIVTIPSNPSEMTANLQGPVIVNQQKRIGRQVISLNDKYNVKHAILEEIKKSTGTKG